MSDDGCILLFAIRYALPRNTSAPWCIARYLHSQAPILAEADKRQMIGEIEDERIHWKAKASSRDDWESVLSALRATA